MPKDELNDEQLDELDDGSEALFTDEASDESAAGGEKEASAASDEDDSGGAEEEEEQRPSKDNRMIPRSRFNEKNEALKAANARIAELQAALEDKGQSQSTSRIWW